MAKINPPRILFLAPEASWLEMSVDPVAVFYLFLGHLKFHVMAKGQDKRKEDKKKPLKTLKEKRAEKKAKKG